MKLNIKALAFSVGILWGIGMLLVCIANLIWPGYADAFLRLMASVYPGYDASGTIGDVITGTLYAAVDGAIGGLVLGWIYNMFAR